MIGDTSLTYIQNIDKELPMMVKPLYSQLPTDQQAKVCCSCVYIQCIECSHSGKVIVISQLLTTPVD